MFITDPEMKAPFDLHAFVEFVNGNKYGLAKVTELGGGRFRNRSHHQVP
jgi:hypothetical protein